jgi:ABC-type methionine transport system permease subunit
MFAPVSDELMRTGTLVSMLAMAGLIGSRWFGQHAVRVRFAVTILYIAAILILVGLHLFVQ